MSDEPRQVMAADSWEDSLPGGLADDRNPGDFDAMELSRGVKTELEHTHSRKLATEIAMDHLTEDPEYYKKLGLVEKTAGIKVPKAFKLKKPKKSEVKVPDHKDRGPMAKALDRARKFMAKRGG